MREKEITGEYLIRDLAIIALGALIALLLAAPLDVGEDQDKAPELVDTLIQQDEITDVIKEVADAGTVARQQPKPDKE